MVKSVKKLKINTTSDIMELVFIMDRSGSMFSLEQDTIGGFNSMIKKQKSSSAKVFVSTVLFNGETTVLHDRIKLEDIPEMTAKDYCPSGSTALLDAVGSSIKHITNIHKNLRKEDLPSRTIIVITTDGYENSSRIYNLNQVKKMIEEQKNKNDWEFLFLGANIDAIDAASQIGIDNHHAANITNDAEGVKTMYKELGNYVRHCCHPKSDENYDWKKKLDDNFSKHKK